MTLFHYTCSDGLVGIARDGVLRPYPQPVLGGIELVWLTDLDTPDRAALGLTSLLVGCDRTEYRIKVDTDLAIHWPLVARRLLPSLRRSLELAPGARPMHWYVSESSVPVDLSKATALEQAQPLPVAAGSEAQSLEPVESSEGQERSEEVEWAVRRDHEGNGTHWVSEPFYRREHAEALLASMNGGGDPMYVVSRRIQAGPWRSTVLPDNSEASDG